MKKIAIIGAGISGLSACTLLQDKGHEVTIFEKSRGSGGRLATKKVNDSSWDMGAQFISANTPAFAETLGLWESQGFIRPWNEQPWVISKEGRKQSPDSKTRYVGIPRMTGLTRKLLAGSHGFVPSTRIIHCEYSNAQWQLASEAGEKFSGFDALIISAPPVQAQALIPKNSTLHDTLTPPPAMQPCWTLLLSFESRLNTDINMAFVKDSKIGWIARNNSKPDREIEEAWVIHANHQWSNENIDTPKDEVASQLLNEFFSRLQLEPISAKAEWPHRWLYAVPESTTKYNSTPDSLYDATQELALCGDWCYRASVEGAWLSGQQAAQRILGDHHE